MLLEANPLEDIRNAWRIRAVIADGRLYRRADLDRLLAEVEASATAERQPNMIRACTGDSSSDLGDWPAGWRLLEELLTRCGHPRVSSGEGTSADHSG